MATGESSDSKVKQTTVIGGHVKKKEGESSVVAPHMAIQPMNMPVSGWPNPLQVDAEVSNTMGEIQDIQAQLSKLMANKPSAEMTRASSSDSSKQRGMPGIVPRTPDTFGFNSPRQQV